MASKLSDHSSWMYDYPIVNAGAVKHYINEASVTQLGMLNSVLIKVFCDLSKKRKKINWISVKKLLTFHLIAPDYLEPEVKNE